MNPKKNRESREFSPLFSKFFCTRASLTGPVDSVCASSYGRTLCSTLTSFFFYLRRQGRQALLEITPANDSQMIPFLLHTHTYKQTHTYFRYLSGEKSSALQTMLCIESTSSRSRTSQASFIRIMSTTLTVLYGQVSAITHLYVNDNQKHFNN